MLGETEEHDDYEGVTPLDWFEYEFGTVAYDNILPEKVQARILNMARTLYKNTLVYTSSSEPGKETPDKRQTCNLRASAN